MDFKQSLSRNLVRSAVAAAGLICTVPALAALEEIIVTAQKRAENVQDVGLTIQAFDERTFRELGASNLDQFAGLISNAQAYLPNTFLQSVHVRGVGLNEFQGQYDSPVGYHVDEVYISKPWMLAREQFDLERVEVLKGPQGTLFGRNTTGGAVNYYTKAPTDKFQAYAEADYDSFNRAMVQGAVSGPIYGNLLGRLSVYSRFGSGGWQENLFDGSDLPRPDVREIRGQLAWSNETTRARVMFHWGENKSDGQNWKAPGIFNIGGGYCPQLLTGEVSKQRDACAKYAGLAIAAGFPEREFEPQSLEEINSDQPQRQDDDFSGGYIKLEHDFSWATLTSLTAYEFFQRNQHEDSDGGAFASTNTHYFNQMKQFNQELRFTGDLSDEWRYVAGMFYEKDELDETDGSNLSENPLGIAPPFAPHFFGDFDIEVESIAMFFHQEYDFTDTLTINVGVRWTQDSTKYDGLTALGFNDPIGDEDRVTPCLITTFEPGAPIGSPACPFLGPLAPNGGVFEDNRTDSNVSWRGGFDWKAAENVLVYLNLTTGYRSGGYSSPFAGAVTQFKPEDIFAKEAGIKSSLFNDTVTWNLAAFHYGYDDIQVNVDDPVSPLVPITRNIGEAVYKGIESEAWWRPDDNWTFRFAFGYLDAEFTRTDRSISTYIGPIPLEGKRPVNAPKWTLNGLVRYQRPVFAGWDLVLSTDARWIDDRFLEATNQAFDAADSYAVVNARGALQSQDGRYEIAVYGRNIFDEEYLTYMNNISFFKLDIWGEPASFGVHLRYNYE